MTDDTSIRERLVALEVSEVHRKGDLARVHTGLATLNTNFEEFKKQSAPKPIPWLKVIPVTIGVGTLTVTVAMAILSLLFVRTSAFDTIKEDVRNVQTEQKVQGEQLEALKTFSVGALQSLDSNMREVAKANRVPEKDLQKAPEPPEPLKEKSGDRPNER